MSCPAQDQSIAIDAASSRMQTFWGVFGGWGIEVSQKASWVKQWKEGVNCSLCAAALALKWIREQPGAFTSQVGRRTTTKIKDIEGVTKNSFAYLPLAASFSVIFLMYVEGVSLSVISIISLVLLK